MLALAALGLALVAVAACGGGSSKGSTASSASTTSSTSSGTNNGSASDKTAVKNLMQQELGDLAKGDYGAAYALYSSKAQAGCSLADYKAANNVDLSQASFDSVDVSTDGQTANSTYLIKNNGTTLNTGEATFEKNNGRWYYSDSPC